MNNKKKSLLISIIVALASQINIGIMNSGFTISAGIIVLIVFLLYFEDLDPIKIGILSGVFVYVLRLFSNFLKPGNLNDVISLYLFEILFYLFYTIIYSFLLKKVEKDNLHLLFIILVISDFSANLVEVLARTINGFSPTIWEVGNTLFVVSIIRSAIIWLIYNAFQYYGFNLLKQEHQDRYKKLLMLTSQLKTELYWLEKNMDHIERVMSDSYELYENIDSKKDVGSWSNQALSIASNVHEIKKENNLLIRGIQEITENELNDDGIEYKDLVHILKESMKREAVELGKNIEFDFHINNNFFVTKHYFLISILRNLINNSIEAISDTKEDGKIKLTNHIENYNHVFIVSDNGSGIDENDLKDIFLPRYSTKINYETGEINRGLGLTIVKNIIEEEFKGSLKVESKLGQGSTFYIYMPRNILEG